MNSEGAWWRNDKRIDELERVRHGVTKNQCRLPDSIWRNGQNSPEYDSGLTDKAKDGMACRVTAKKNNQLQSRLQLELVAARMLWDEMDFKGWGTISSVQ